MAEHVYMSDLSNLLGSVYDSPHPDARAVPQEPPASERRDVSLEQALSAAIDEAAGHPGPPAAQAAPPAPAAPAPAAPAPAAPAYQPEAYGAPQPEAPASAPVPQPEAPAYAPVPQVTGWQLGDDDIVPGAAAKRAKKR